MLSYHLLNDDHCNNCIIFARNEMMIGVLVLFLLCPIISAELLPQCIHWFAKVADM